MSIIDELSKLGNKPNPAVPMNLPKKPSSAPSGKPSYVPVEVENADGSQIVSSFLAHILNVEFCSDEDREYAFRTLANATGRKLVVSWFEVAKITGAAVGLLLATLLFAKAIYFPNAKVMYTSLIPWLLGTSSSIMFGLTIVYKRQPDWILTILCVADGVMFAIAISSLL